MKNCLSVSVVCLFMALTHVGKLHAESTISIPISASLTDIAATAERALPVELVNETAVQTCVGAKRVCTKIPEFRGFKIYSRMECIDVTPRIGCSIDQAVRRAGTISVTGSGNTLNVRQSFNGQATVRGRGEIGRHIRETATGTAEIAVSIAPRVTEDWRVDAQVSHQIGWPQTPKAKLFNIFDVTFQSKATSKINQVVEAFKANDLRPQLNRINLREKITPLWQKLQEPVPVKLPGTSSSAYLYFSPDSVALAPLNFDNNRASTRLAIKGQFQLTDEERDWKSADLPNLSADAPPPGLSLELPIRLGMDTLSALAETKMPVRLNFGQPVTGTLDIRSVSFEEEKNGVLLVRLKTRATAANLLAAEASLKVRGTPKWNAVTRTLSLETPTLEVEGGVAAWFLDGLASSATARRYIAEALRLHLGGFIDQTRSDLSAALARELADGVSMQGAVDSLTIDKLQLKDGLHLTATAHGKVSVSALELK